MGRGLIDVPLKTKITYHRFEALVELVVLESPDALIREGRLIGLRASPFGPVQQASLHEIEVLAVITSKREVVSDSFEIIFGRSAGDDEFENSVLVCSFKTGRGGIGKG